MKVLYVRMSDEAHAYIAAMSARSGLSMTTITGLMLDEARRRGWQVETSAARITDTSDSPAASFPAPQPRDQGQAPGPEIPPAGTREPGPPWDGVLR